MTYSAIIHLNGQDYPVSASGPVPGLPGYSVLFYPGEIEGKWGVMAPAAGKPVPVTPVDLGAYTVDILNNGTLVKTISLTQHQWLGGWQYKISPDTIKTTPAQLLASGEVPYYGNADITPPRTAPIVDDSPNGSCGIARYMPTTGERPDIGLHTDRQAEALLFNADAPSLANLICEANGFQSMPVWQYDPTGKPWDVITHPFDCTNIAAGPQFFIGSDSPAPSPVPATRWSMDAAHNPRWPYLLYRMTGETRYLRIGQFYTARFLMGGNDWSRVAGYAVIGQGQDRGVAWVLCDLVCVVLATRAEEAKCAALGIPFPSDLRPYAYWKQVLDNQLKWYTHAYLGDPVVQRFGVWPVQGWISPWQQDHFNNVVFWITRNFPEWAPAALSLAKNVLARTSGKSGWAPAQPSSYRLQFGPTYKDTDVWSTGRIGTIKLTDVYADWGAVWANYVTLCNTPAGFANMTQAKIQILMADPYGGGNWIGWDKASPIFTHECLAQLVNLQRLGILDVDGAYPGENLEATYTLQHNFMKKQGLMSPRWSIAVQSQGGIIMPTAVTITKGQKVHLDVTFVGPNPPTPPTYTQNNAAAGALVGGDMTGVLFDSTTGTAPLPTVSTVTANAQGASGPLSASCVVTVNPPLPTGMALTPGVIS